jgi:putative membrane protein
MAIYGADSLFIGAAACGGSEPPARSPDQQPTSPPPASTSTVTPGTMSPGTSETTTSGTTSSGATGTGATAPGSGTYHQQGGTATSPGGASLPANQGAIGSGPPSATDSSGRPMGATSAPLSDAQILYVLNTINAGEMEQARIAQQKASNGRVKRFASMMMKDHNDADKKAGDVSKKVNATPAPSEVSRMLETDAKQATSAMSTRQGTDFDRSYMDAQVKEHRTALDLIDRQLMPSATSSEVKDMLKNVRSTIESHLKEAQEIQKQLGGS